MGYTARDGPGPMDAMHMHIMTIRRALASLADGPGDQAAVQPFAQRRPGLCRHHSFCSEQDTQQSNGHV